MSKKEFYEIIKSLTPEQIAVLYKLIKELAK